MNRVLATFDRFSVAVVEIKGINHKRYRRLLMFDDLNIGFEDEDVFDFDNIEQIELKKLNNMLLLVSDEKLKEDNLTDFEFNYIKDNVFNIKNWLITIGFIGTEEI